LVLKWENTKEDKEESYELAMDIYKHGYSQ
jgi:hypothetical protein